MLDKFKEGAAGAAAQKAQELLREFNDTIPTLKALGLSVSNISFGMGLVPEIGATFIGSVDALEQDKIRDLMERHRDKKTRHPRGLAHSWQFQGAVERASGYRDQD